MVTHRRPVFLYMEQACPRAALLSSYLAFLNAYVMYIRTPPFLFHVNADWNSFGETALHLPTLHYYAIALLLCPGPWDGILIEMGSRADWLTLGHC